MSRQNRFMQKMDKSGRATTVRSNYAMLAPMREEFRWTLRQLYTSYRDKIGVVGGRAVPESIESLIEKDGFPPNFGPSVRNPLPTVREQHKRSWNALTIWEFARFVYPISHGINDGQLPIIRTEVYNELFDRLRETQRGLAYFWDNSAAELDDIREYVQFDWRELVILTWLELAFARNIGADMPGKINLFRLAKAKWQAFRESQNRQAPSDRR